MQSTLENFEKEDDELMKVKTRRIAFAACMILLVCVMASVAGCSEEASLSGEYIGTAGSYLRLNDDGTCIYAEDDSTGTGTGTWKVEDDIIYINVSNIRLTIYGDITNADDGILLQCDLSSWNDEYFRKND